ncbi:MAG: hypothetical protein ACKOAU_16525, partial [Pirellula sp.]
MVLLSTNERIMAQGNWRDRENPDTNHLFFHRKEVLAIADQEKLQLQVAISRGLERLSVGVENYPKHRSCFSCHHQSVPLLAYRLNTSRSELFEEDWGKRETIRQGILEFTRASLEKELGS